MAGVAFTQLRMRAARSAFFAYMLDKSESRPSISFINFHSDVAGLCDCACKQANENHIFI